MKIIEYPASSQYSDICKRPNTDYGTMAERVMPIIENVKANGDMALRQYALDFDNLMIDDFKVSKAEISAATAILSLELKTAIDIAFDNIYKFHKAQFKIEEPIETMSGVLCWRKSVGIDKVGIYIPGGSAPLFSTVLMLGVPAMIAGCKQVVLCSPSNHPAIYYAAHKAGIKEIYRVGGAQAIAAMAFGTEQIPQVYKIFGPGNQYVTTAKQIVTQYGTAIDMPAGPSEVAVFADSGANAVFVAADLLAQAEHGADSQVILVSTDLKLINDTLFAIEEQLKILPRAEIAQKAIENSKAVLVENDTEAIDLLNEYAAEHLILSVREPETIADKITNAGSMFLGDYTPESCGDYASGTNHTLPTNAFARAYSGVSVDSFVKKITFQKIDKSGLRNLGPHVEIMAKAEGLEAHAQAVTLRLASL